MTLDRPEMSVTWALPVLGALPGYLVPQASKERWVSRVLWACREFQVNQDPEVMNLKLLIEKRVLIT